MVRHCLNRTEPRCILIIKTMFESSGNHQRKIPVIGSKIVLYFRCDVGCRNDKLTRLCDPKIINSVIAITCAFEFVERVTFCKTNLKQYSRGLELS